MVKNSEKSQKISKNYFFFKKNIFEKKICLPKKEKENAILLVFGDPPPPYPQKVDNLSVFLEPFPLDTFNI